MIKVVTSKYARQSLSTVEFLATSVGNILKP